MKDRGAQKHERDAVRMIERTIPGARAAVETRRGKNAHKWLVVSKDETEVRVCLAGSPSVDVNNLLQHLRRNTVRALREKGVAL